MSQYSFKELIEKLNSFSNPNYLINSDFKINQRGNTSYTDKDYSFDRWKINNDNTKVETSKNGVRLSSTKVDEWASLVQPIERQTTEKLLGKTITASIFTSEGFLSFSGDLKHQVTDEDYAHLIGHAIGENVNIVVWQYPNKLEFQIESNTIGVEVFWTKLEIGSYATKYVPMPYADELLACYRYYYKVGSSTNKWFLYAPASYSLNNVANCIITLPVPMRSIPNLSYTGNFRFIASGDKSYPLSKIAIGSVGVNTISLSLTGQGMSGAGFLNGNDSATYLIFDAEVY